MNILIIGACSAIAKACARRYAVQGHSFMLLARHQESLEKLAKDLTARGAEAVCYRIADFAIDDYLAAMQDAVTAMGQIDLVLMAHSVLGEQEHYQNDIETLEKMLQINSISSIKMLTVLANVMEQQGTGKIAFISSVAGDRGRASNYAYGSSKAIMNTFLQGLRARLSRANVHVLNVKPGFVDTPMTASVEKKGLLWAQPEDVALGIEKALNKQKSEVYLPWFWCIIMGIIKRIPTKIFNKLNF